jgi:hypothetical protein
MADLPIGSSRLLQQNLPTADIRLIPLNLSSTIAPSP